MCIGVDVLLPARPSRLTCYVSDGVIFEAPVQRLTATGVFVPCTRDDLQLTNEVRVDFHSDPPISFHGTVSTWVRGRGVRIEAGYNTPTEVLDVLSRWAAEDPQSGDLPRVEAREPTPVPRLPPPRLPTPAPKAAPTPALEASAPAKTSKQPITDTRRLLIVDDDPGILKMLHRRLSRFGYDIAAVDSPPDALELLHKQDVDAVLLDWMLPTIPGYDMLKEIKQEHPGLPVAVVSGSLWWQNAEAELLTLGASRVFPKPIDLEAVAAWLEVATHR
jgi:CheY-like chemotaxis protein